LSVALALGPQAIGTLNMKPADSQPAAPSVPPGSLQAAGLRALDQKKYAEAEQIFAKLTTADPKDFSAFFNLALAETAQQKNEQAATHFQHVLALKPGLYEAELNLGILKLSEHKPADALTLLRDAAKQKPDQARPQRYLGDALLATGDLDGAAVAYRAALVTDPKMAAAELGLGQVLLQQKKLDEALPHYRQAVTLNPGLNSYLLEIGSVYSAANQPDKAIELLKDFPKDPGAQEELGRLYLKAGRPADGVAAFEAAVLLSPTPANYLALATAYLQNKQPDSAEPILQKALATNPNDFDIRMALGRIRLEKHQYAPAATEFLAAANARPNSVTAWNEAATALVLSKQDSQALAALDQVHNLNADTAGNYFFRAIVLDRQHQVKPALASYQRFLEMAQGKYPDQEFQARQRSRILEKEASR
jgi:tetratricopeptide (TPR) repeat protein